MQHATPHSVNMIVTGWRQENDLVYVKLSQGKYQLGDKLFTIPYSGGEQIIDLAEIENLYRVFEENRLTGYKNLDTDETIGIEAYMTQKQALDKREYNEELEQEIWKKITDRHAFELFTALWTPIREAITTTQRVEIHLEGEVPKTEHPHIKPIRKISGDLTNTLYSYSKAGHVFALVTYFLTKNGYRHLDQEPPSFGRPKDMDKTFWLKSDLQFSKMFPSKDAGEKWLTIEIPGLKQYEKSNGRNTGTFAELEAIYNVVDADIRAIMGSYFNKNKALADLPEETIGKALAGLESLAKNIRKIDSMKKTYSEYAAACKEVDALIKTFRGAASQ